MKKMLLLILSFIVILLVGCESASDEYLIRKADEKVNVNYQVLREDGYLQFMQKLNVFSGRITTEINEKFGGNDNIAVSPLSIYMAMAMAVECANGTTREELLNALGMSYEEVAEYTKILYALNNLEKVDSYDKVISREMLTNSIWANDSIELKEEGIENLGSKYHANLFSAPFSSDNEKANKAVQDFIKENTKGLINKKFNFSKETLFLLINTLYLKDTWNEFGEFNVTKEEYQFTNLYNGNVIKTKLLESDYYTGRVYEEESFNHFYVKSMGGYKLKFIVPKNGYNINDVFTTENIIKVNMMSDYNSYNELENTRYYTRVLFPKFNAAFDNDIKGVLQQLGVHKLFTINCDYSNIIDSIAYCSSVIHATKLKVDESGMEGAAVTIIANDGSSAPIGKSIYEDFIVNNSFGFLITKDDAVLFSGVVNEVQSISIS